MAYNLAFAMLAMVAVSAAEPPAPGNDYNRVRANGQVQDSGCTAADKELIAKQVDQLALVYGGSKEKPGVLSEGGWGGELLHRCSGTINLISAPRNLVFISPPQPVAKAAAPVTTASVSDH